jgi:hypothetical protein
MLILVRHQRKYIHSYIVHERRVFIVLITPIYLNSFASLSFFLGSYMVSVVSMSLSGDGRYLYSGGEEGVLVVWQLATGFKDFVPRLGAAITHVAAR